MSDETETERAWIIVVSDRHFDDEYQVVHGTWDEAMAKAQSCAKDLSGDNPAYPKWERVGDPAWLHLRCSGEDDHVDLRPLDLPPVYEAAPGLLGALEAARDFMSSSQFEVEPEEAAINAFVATMRAAHTAIAKARGVSR